MKITLEADAEFIDWKDTSEKLNDVIQETARKIKSIEFSYSNEECD